MYCIIYIYNTRPVTQKLHLFLARSDYGKSIETSHHRGDIGDIHFEN